ncbi:putative acetolactate synthase large subunit IlvX [Variibacter gotjawalensis]|uniref:Putative acetolactate synthase large subunit IlvX n=2 Tax=Variibacter gotjawalensis TaxID=1333996 RepID=A0A0S3PQW3_9BRAD|nr:acetolactate synthase-1/2/3 large subunit [Variibacter gotjawalensis]RZS50463.1 acetolactate synthase-1/2/3 large subunit [Variibacter gotjawalensis]BAT58297.1 putative acetolactate synthase large subunit IlvX [Variibacter gotjawalensis]
MTETMNGAESLVRTLVDGGVNVSFTNPGTSEMHFVAALDRVEGMRCILTLFEGVATGAADGYARMAEKPASTLLHLGPGLANGLANLHNAKKASTPMVNIVGDHATYHRDYDAPLTSDIETAAKPFSGWVRTSPNAKRVAEDGAAAVAAAQNAPGQVATLILPGDTAWDEGSGPAKIPEIPTRKRVSEEAVRASAKALTSGEPALLLLAGAALKVHGLELAARIAAKTGCRFMAQTFNARMDRGAGSIAIERIPYPVDQAVETLKGLKHIVLAGSRVPVGFFAYPNKPSLLSPKDTEFTKLAELEEDIVHALEWLADELGATKTPITNNQYAPPKAGTGKIGAATLAPSIGALIPENAIVVDEGVSTGRGFFPMTQSAHPHVWLQNMGGSIGIGMPLATGAAVACPDRPVLNLEGDGSAMYTIQALWTQAREQLNVTTVIFANRKYAILLGELVNVGAQNVGRKALDMLDLSRPDLNFVDLARGMGVPGERVTDMESFNKAVAHGLSTPGPYLIEAMID